MDEQGTSEDPGASLKKRRGLQGRDLRAAQMGAQGLPMGSGRTYDRMMYVVRKIKALQAEGCEQEARLLAQALDTSTRGAEQLARLPADFFQVLCQGVLAGEARNLLEAYREVRDALHEDEGPLTLSPARGGLYRLTSQRNKSSILVSAEDLLDLVRYVQDHWLELEEHSHES